MLHANVYDHNNIIKHLQQGSVQKVDTGVGSLRIIDNELYCCTTDVIEVYSLDLQSRRSITSSSVGWFCDVAEKDKGHVFVATRYGLFVFTKSGRNITLLTS